jgi:hypothetical protein
MKITQADLPKIQHSLIAAVLMIVLGASAVLYALERAHAAQIAQSVADKAFKEFDGKLKQVRTEENDIKLKAALFKQLQARGAIGEERRLDWSELLNGIREQRHLIGLEYEIAAQRPLDAHSSKDFGFYASTMQLHVKLLHEEDLTRLFFDLRSQAQALIQIKSCKLSRLVNGATERAARQANLLADCEIDWITLREAVTP